MLQVADNIEIESPQDKLISRLRETLAGYLDQNIIADCVRAYEFGAAAHAANSGKAEKPISAIPSRWQSA